MKNQNYFLQNYIIEEHKDLPFILNQIKNDSLPLAFIEPGRFADNLYRKQFFDDKNNLIKLNNDIWIPYHPAELFHALSPNRSKKIIQRWINRHPHEMGWFINTRNSDIDHWHKIYEDFLFDALKDYQIVNKIEHGELKAILFKRN